MAEKTQGYTTKVLSTPYPKKDAFNSLHMPVYDTVAYEFDSAEDIADAFQDRKPAHAYSRSSNPSVEYFERKLAAVTDARAVLALTSGMAAISNAILAVVQRGENFLTSGHLFGHTYGLFSKTLPDLGIEARFCDLLDPDNMEKHIDGNTRMVFFETVTNPQLEVVDISKIVKLARKHGILVMADSTLTPCNVFNARSLGIDIEVMSSTKFISGGATSVGGVIVDTGLNDWSTVPKLEVFRERAGERAFIMKLRKEIYRNFGSCMAPRTAQMQSFGLDVLALRVERAYQNCMRLTAWLGHHDKVRQLNYPGFQGSPYHALSKRQFNGIPGSILTFDLSSEEECFRFMNKLRIIRRATNMNDNKSLIIHPWSTIYAEFPEKIRLGMKVRPAMLRLSVGIEDADDLIADIEQAMRLD